MTTLTSRVLALSALALLVSACALGGAETRYRLIALQVQPPAEARTDVTLPRVAVARPEADRTRDSTRILVRRGRVLLPWSGAAWIDRSPELVQDLLVEYLDGRVALAGRVGGLAAPHRLDLVLRRFELVETEGGLAAELVLVARLFETGGELVAATTLERRERAGAESLDEAMAAMEAATAGVFAELAGWLAPHLESAPEAAGPTLTQ